MRYLLYDFAESSKPIKDLVMPSWARITLDMDPGDITTIEDEGSVEEAREAWQAMRAQVRAPAS